MKIAVVGLGYVGLAVTVLLAQRHEVVALDVDAERVGLVNDRRSPIEDPDIEEFLATRQLDLRATTDPAEAFPGADFVVIATPTNYDPEADFFNTSTVEEVIAQVGRLSPGSVVVIKSTIPVGFTTRMQSEHPNLRILFSPEFLREGQALYDNLHPSRIVVAGPAPHAQASPTNSVLIDPTPAPRRRAAWTPRQSPTRWPWTEVFHLLDGQPGAQHVVRGGHDEGRLLVGGRGRVVQATVP